MKKILFGIAIILFSAMCYIIYEEMRWEICQILYVLALLLALLLRHGAHLKKGLSA